jgi:hypothetical protein
MLVVLAVTLGATIALSAVAYGVGMLVGRLSSGSRRSVPEPDGRPIEAIVADLHRLGGRFHTLDPRTSFAKVEAVRCAYDRSLAECCAALGITHLLGVIPAGPELDVERERVEEQLAGCGVRLPHAA